MPWRNPQGRTGYHHGDLRKALIAAARKLIAEFGPQGFSLNEASKAAGVSTAAPYRHFKDRSALIEATAQEGFLLFRERLLASQSGARNGHEALHRMGAAYFAFALEEPGFYQAMFSSGLPQVNQAVAEAGARAFKVLEDAVRRMGKPDTDARALALKIWAISHGMAGLLAAGAVNMADAGKLAASGVDALLRDAGLIT